MRDLLERLEIESFPAEICAAGPVQRVSALVRRVSEFLESHPNVILACLLTGYLATSIPTAVLRPYWLDELVEAYICAQPSMGAVWHSLQTAPPTTDPPLHYWLTHLCLRLFGVHEWASRLPALAGFFVAILSTYHFVRRRLGVPVAVVAVTLLLSSNAMYYASEGRPYGLVVGSCGIMLLAWQSVGMGIRPRANRILIAVGLACAISAHYYGILFGLPIVAGEVVRSWRKQRIDWATFFAIASGHSAMLLWIPFLPVAMAWKAHIWFVPAFEDVMQILGDLGDIQLITLFLAALFLVHSSVPAETERGSEKSVHLRRDEAVAILTLVLLPFVGFFVSKFASKLFLSRYVIASSIGVAILIASMSSILRFSRRAWISIIAILLFCFVLGMKARFLRSKFTERKEFAASIRQFAALPGPIVVCMPHDFLPLYFYGTPELRNKIYWLSDLQVALKYIKTDTDVRMMSSVQKVKDTHVVDMRDFLQHHRSFYVYQRKQGNYDLPMMLENGIQLAYLGHRAGGDFFHATNGK